tara:strand:- start:9572 stop:9886 length:315 start_codon:yes stop_codon:yes gene_type:complete
MPLTTIKDGVRRANLTFIEFNGADHRNKIFEQLAKECGFSKTGNQIWTHLKDRNYAIQFNSHTRNLWAEYKLESKIKKFNTPSVSLFIDEVLSFIRDFYMNKET